tara:strand:+ start:910 stop:2058 length:1149 start_codon:yes stop_codon:yes gene_type:complete
MLGIFIGIAAVVALIGLSEGLEEGIVGQFASIGPDIVTIQAASAGFAPPGSTAVTKLTEDDLNAVRGTRGISLAAARLLRSTTIEFNDALRFGFVVSMPEDPEERRLVVDAVNVEMEEGRMLRSTDKFKVILGSDYNEKNLFGKPLAVGNKILLNEQEVSVIGFIERSSNPQFNDIVWMNEEAMRDLLNVENEVDILVARITNVNDMDLVRERLEKLMRKQRNVEEGKEDFTIETPDQVIETFNTILNLVQGIIVGIAGISLVVGGVGIANTMFTSVLERRKEIGILKAIGARNNTILGLFMFEAGLLGVLGGLIGIALGVGFAKSVEFIGTQMFGEGLLQASFSPYLLVGVILFAFIVGVVSGIVPARQAALIPPVEALRK